MEEEKRKIKWWFWPLISIGIFLFLLACSLFFFLLANRNKIFPGVRVGEANFSGLTREQATRLLDTTFDQMFNQGIYLFFETNEGKREAILYGSVSDANPVDWVLLDMDKEVDRLMRLGKSGKLSERVNVAFGLLFGNIDLKLKNIEIDEERILDRLKQNMILHESAAKNAEIKLASVQPLEYEILPEERGVLYLYDQTIAKITDDFSHLRRPVVELPRVVDIPKITREDILVLESRLPKVFSYGALALTYVDPQTGLEFSWNIDTEFIKENLTVEKNDNNDLYFGLKAESLDDFLLSEVATELEVEAKNARFVVEEDGRVSEFEGSRPGVKLDLEATRAAVNDAIRQRGWHDEGVVKAVAVLTIQTEPEVKTGEVNDLGIKEVLGTGVSNFAGSPTNRVKNIRNAVRKLNGILIKPDEVFSSIKYTQPYTIEGGYLPELVIKGDEIKPEIGGGLCQIGTTLFRMAMNSAMPIVERRNHSLVISYYSDPVNHLPGTDATIYDPAPDFQFKNNTGHYILLQTEIDEQKKDLIFTLWGTGDGRRGYFSHPVVHRWLSPGPTKNVETTSLPAGEKKCQHAYRGADASFTYTIELPDGTKEEKVFESHYRALPEICLVGVEQKTACAEGEVCVPPTETTGEIVAE